jgi:hypothetical protein
MSSLRARKLQRYPPGFGPQSRGAIASRKAALQDSLARFLPGNAKQGTRSYAQRPEFVPEAFVEDKEDGDKFLAICAVLR